MRIGPSLRRLSLVILAAAATMACSADDTPEAAPAESSTVPESTTIPAPDDVRSVADALGCDALELGVAFQFGGASQAYTCEDGGAPVGLIHSFATDRQEAVSRYLGSRSGANPCTDRSQPPGPWIVVGPTWAATSYDEARVRAVAAEVGGDYVGGGETATNPPIGPPPSYEIPGRCRG